MKDDGGMVAHGPGLILVSSRDSLFQDFVSSDSFSLIMFRL